MVKVTKPEKLHCKTTTPIKNNIKWYLGRYNKEKDSYEIIKEWSMINRRKSNFISEKWIIEKELNKPSEEEIEKGRKFKEDVNNGRVKAIVDNEIVTIHKYGFRYKKPFVRYMKNNEDIKTFKFKIVE